MNQNNKKIRYFAVIFFGLGILFQNILFSVKSMNIPKDVNEEDMQLFWDVWKTMEEKYPFEEPGSTDKIYRAIKGLVYSYGDDFSDFYPPEKTKIFQDTIDGAFGGAGMEIGVESGLLVIISPLKGSPAEKAGLLPGDIITHIEGVEVYNKSLDEVTSEIRGEVGTELKLTILRKGQGDSLEMKVMRDIVHIPVLDTDTIDGTFIISLYNFNAGSEGAFKQALEEFKKTKLEYLLIDVRNNPGGYLNSSIDISSYFLSQGEVVVIEDFGDSGRDQNIHRSKGYSLLGGKKYTLGVLINEGSASASEIFAGALQDNKKALIMGNQSYGKGSMQDVISLDNDTSLKVTIGKWLTPNKEYISHTGISPDILIDENTTQFFIQEAIKNLKNKVS